MSKKLVFLKAAIKLEKIENKKNIPDKTRTN